MNGTDKFGFRLGTKRSLAAKLYETGATQREMIQATGTNQYNMLKAAERHGHKVVTKGKRTWLVHRDEAGKAFQKEAAATEFRTAPPDLSKRATRSSAQREDRMFVPVHPSVVSIVGWHANESLEQILARKIHDISTSGLTFWVYQSWKAQRETVQEFAKANGGAAVYFLEGSAVPTSNSQRARQLSGNGIRWENLPSGLGPVTGKIPGGVALVIDELSVVADRWIDTWSFIEQPSGMPLRFARGASTVCAVPSSGGAVSGMKSRIRRVVAVGRLAAPYAVMLR